MTIDSNKYVTQVVYKSFMPSDNELISVDEPIYKFKMNEYNKTSIEHNGPFITFPDLISIIRDIKNKATLMRPFEIWKCSGHVCPAIVNKIERTYISNNKILVKTEEIPEYSDIILCDEIKPIEKLCGYPFLGMYDAIEELLPEGINNLTLYQFIKEFNINTSTSMKDILKKCIALQSYESICVMKNVLQKGLYL